jgi:Ca-activated chloride channel family protein
MAGDSMKQARVALKHLFKQLKEDDCFAYTRFGSSIDRVTKKMTMAYSERIQTLLSTLDKTEADLGGTELGMAMTDVFNMNANGKARNNPEVTDSADVLLITDGDVWNIENILASARISGHRVYTIGVGSAPAESLLRELAKDTGGSCEFVTPREDMRGAVDRMLTRMRSAQEVRFAIKWNAIEDQHKDHEWASTLPPQLIDGETVHLYARLPAKTEKAPVLICKTLVKEEEQEVSSAKPLSITWDTEGIVARLVAAAQIGELTEGKADTKLAKSLAMKYQLVTQHTNLFLVHERAEENKADGLPKLQQVAQMQAAGFGGYGSVGRAETLLSICRMSSSMDSFEISDSLSAPSLGGDYGRLNTPSVWRTNRTQAAAKVDGMASAGMDDIEIPAFLRKQSDTVDQRVQSSTTSPDAVEYAGSSDPSLFSQLSSKIKDFISPSAKPQTRVLTDELSPEEPTPSEASKVEIAMALNTAALQASSFRIALQHTLKLNMPSHYAAVIIDLTKVTKDSATSWALLLEWLFGDIEQSGLLERHAQRLLRSQLKLATEEMRDHAQILIESNLIIIN